MSVTIATLAPDAALPFRDALLDDESLRARLSALLRREVERCERRRATYRPGRSLRVLLEVSVGGEPGLVSARMFAPGTSASRYERARVQTSGVVHDGELSTLFFTYPADRKLTALPRLADAAPSGTVAHVVAYAPEKAVTARAVDGSGEAVAFVKLYADDSWLRACRVHAALRAQSIDAPAVLASLPELRALTIEPLRGDRPGDADGYRAFGAALARLHALQPVDARRFTRLDPDSLSAAARTIACVRPDVAELALALEQALRDAPPGAARLVCLHGDVHAKNVLVHDGGAALVDLDDVAGGDAAADLGSALAGLRYGELVGRAGRESAQPLLDGYADEAPLPGVDALRWHTAAALLGERALRAVTRLRPAGLEQLDEVLAAGLEELG